MIPRSWSVCVAFLWQMVALALLSLAAPARADAPPLGLSLIHI